MTVRKSHRVMRSVLNQSVPRCPALWIAQNRKGGRVHVHRGKDLDKGFVLGRREDVGHGCQKLDRSGTTGQRAHARAHAAQCIDPNWVNNVATSAASARVGRLDPCGN